jgi:AcrR family transcriptional regulator
MSIQKKRSYNSESRQVRSQNTKDRILTSAKELFKAKGFDAVTIEEIARDGQVSAPSIYSIFQSKRGILLNLMDHAFLPEQHSALVEQITQEQCPRKRLALTATLSRRIYDAEKDQLGFLKGASILDPVFKELEIEREQRRYLRQKETVEAMANEKTFKSNLSLPKIRDLIWAFTGRDFYRMLVIERGWSSNTYETWLAELLIKTILSE